MLCGLLAAQSGEVRALPAPDARGVPIARPCRPAAVLYLGAQPILLPGSLRDNLMLDERRAGAAPPALDDVTDLAPVRAALARDGIPLDWEREIVDAGGSGLSSGQAQLVQLARAVGPRPGRRRLRRGHPARSTWTPSARSSRACSTGAGAGSVSSSRTVPARGSRLPGSG